MKLSLLKNLMVFAGFAFLLTSCDPDGGIIDPPGEDDPLVSVTGIPSAPITAGSVFTISISGTPTDDNQLKSVAFKEGNQNISFSRITVDGTPASANPILLFGSDKDGVAWSVDIVAHETVGVEQYEVEFTDEGNNVGGFTFDVETELVVENPTISIAGEMTVMVPSNSVLLAKTTLGMGTYDLSTLTFYQGDNTLDASRVTFGNTAIDNNPFALPSDFADGGEVDIFLRVQETAGTETYRFVVEDVEGNTAEEVFDITTGTNVDTLDGVLFNAGGPQGTGGLDLDTGESTNSDDAAAEIRDLGIDLDEPAASNWIQRITGANNATLKAIVPGENGLLESFEFESVGTKEDIVSLYENNSEDLDDNTSGTVEAGDIYVVKRDDDYYIFIVREVNVVTTDNSDNYVLDIRK
ncbi:hypothetical protein [Portibacter marinus]|uniref:hypothetical protein n=1 Tax=Portibacter marinus TaxID=2898660 RepID=UPI001F47F525|nr:hypothetical protein [Portibacter marinus]